MANLTLVVGLGFLLSISGLAASAAAENQTAPPSSAYPQPPACPEGSYWDHERQACMGHDAPSSPNGTYGGEPYQDPCFAKMREAEPIFHEFRMNVESHMRAFQEEFNHARMEFSGSPHSSDEWRAFMEQWQERGKSMFEAKRAAFEAALREALGDCFGRMHVEGMMEAPPGFAMGPQAPHPEGGFAHLPPPPAQGDERFRLSEAAQKVRMECEAKARALMGESAGSAGPKPSPSRTMYESYPSSSTYPRPAGAPYASPSHPMMSEEMELRMRELWRECEQRIREIMMAERGDMPNDDFRERFGSLEMFFDPDKQRILVQGRHLAMEGDPESQMMEKITCDGALFIDRAFVNGLLAEFHPEQTKEGTALMVYDSDKKRVFSIHDNPRCVINLAATAEVPSITVDLADHLDVEVLESGDLRFSDGEVDGRLLLHGADADVDDGNVVVIDGRATFVVKSHGASSAALGGSRYDDAIEKKRLGAEVKIAKGEKDLDVDAVPLGDLEVEVEGGKDKVKATIDSAEGTGKTVVLEIDGDVFSGDELRVLVTGENNASLVFSEASSLEDVLDPSDDGPDGIEYWIVEDKNGFHVLVSFAHFSVKHVTITSVDHGANLIPGFETFMLLGAMVAAGWTARRRLA